METKNEDKPKLLKNKLKSITKYVAIDGYSLSTSNNLQKEIANYLKSLDRTLIDKYDLEVYKTIIIKDIEILNLRNKRCKPIKVSWNFRGNFWHLSGITFKNFNIYGIYNEF